MLAETLSARPHSGRPVQPRYDPRFRPILANLEHATSGLGSATDAPPGHKGTSPLGEILLSESIVRPGLVMGRGHEGGPHPVANGCHVAPNSAQQPQKLCEVSHRGMRCGRAD
jgi:hypothetical protein